MPAEIEMELQPKDLAAIAIMARELGKLPSEELPPGKGYEVDMMIHLKATVNKAANGTTTRKTVPKVEDMVAYFMARLTPEARRLYLEQFQAHVSLNNGVKVNDQSAKADAAAMLAIATTSATGPRSGAVTGTVQISAVGLQDIPATMANRLDGVTRRINLSADEETEETEPVAG